MNVAGPQATSQSAIEACRARAWPSQAPIAVSRHRVEPAVTQSEKTSFAGLCGQAAMLPIPAADPQRRRRLFLLGWFAKKENSKLLQRSYSQAATLLPLLVLAGMTSTLARPGTPSAGAVCRAASVRRALSGPRSSVATGQWTLARDQDTGPFRDGEAWPG
jgi:hypothetical protein